jgi:heme/copper-type cytochrome/quinol oxidase subunit 2
MSLLTVLLILAVFGVVFVLVLTVVIRIEVAREQAAGSDQAREDKSVE